jgi:hypothetical protein
MDKFKIYLFVLNFWHYLFSYEELDISNIKIENEIETEVYNSDALIYSDIEE